MSILTTEDFINVGEWMESIAGFDNANRPTQTLKNKVLASVFLEPSTRTRLSFEAAMCRLGGKVITVADGKMSSAMKGETLYDTLMTVGQYADGIVVRNPEALGAPSRWANLPCPIINAGDGANHHPTQALLDAYTIWKHKGTLEYLKICVVGDLENSRAIRSFVDLMGRNASNVIFSFNSLEDKQLPKRFGASAQIHHLGNQEEFDHHLPEFDVLYLNRVQTERHLDRVDGLATLLFAGFAFGSFRLNLSHMSSLKRDALVMNPGPRLQELPPDFDNDPRVVFFEQARNGVAARMAVLSTVMQ